MTINEIITIYNQLEVNKIYSLNELRGIFNNHNRIFDILFCFGTCKKVKEETIKWTEEEIQKIKAECGNNVIFKPQTIRYYEITKKYNILQVIINLHNNIANIVYQNIDASLYPRGYNIPPLECWFDGGYYAIVDYAYKNDKKNIYKAKSITIKHTDCYIKDYRDFLMENNCKDFICLDDNKEYWLAEELGECEVVFDA